jgi:hypothetical protein
MTIHLSLPKPTFGPTLADDKMIRCRSVAR